MIYELRTCPQCEEPKTLNEFFLMNQKRTLKDGSVKVYSYFTICFECNRLNVKKHALNNPEYREKQKAASRACWKKYGRQYEQNRKIKNAL